MYREKGIDPVRHYSDKFQARLPEKEHVHTIEMATAHGINLNQLIRDSLTGIEA